MTTLDIRLQLEDEEKSFLDALVRQSGKSLDEIIIGFIRRRAELARQSQQEPFRMSDAYRNQIRNVSVWSDEDIKPIEEAQALWHFETPQW